MNTPSTAHQSLLNSKTYKNGAKARKDGWFSVIDVSEEIGITKEMAQVVLNTLRDSGIATKKRIKRTEKGGITWVWKKIALTPKAFFATSFRRHTNEELGCGSTYFGRYYA